MRRLFLVFSICALSLAAQPARAVDPLRATLTQDRSMDASDYPIGRKLAEVQVALAAGESRMIYGRLEARSESARGAEQQVGVGCDGLDGGTLRTSRNNEGNDARYVGGYGILTIDVRYLFTASTATTYTCALWGKSSANTLTALGRGSTYIEVTDALAGATQWGLDQPCDSNGSVSGTPDNAFDSECRYLVPRSAEQSTWSPSTVALLQPSFVADPAATNVLATADLQITTCYRDTSSCIDTVDRFGGRAGSYSLLDSRLDVFQLDANGTSAGCGSRASFPALGAGNSPDSNFQRVKVGRNTHHLKLRYQVRMPVSTTEGCTRTFLLRVVLRATEGDPVKLGGSKLNSRGGVRLAFSNGIARNAF